MERTRKECYIYVKSNKKLQKQIFKRTGHYYPNLSTEELNAFVEADYNSLINKIKRLFGK